MNDDYEFRVTGLIGPLTRAAMPELDSYRYERETTLIGTAPDEQHIRDFDFFVHILGETFNVNSATDFDAVLFSTGQTNNCVHGFLQFSLTAAVPVESCDADMPNGENWLARRQF